MRAGTVARLTGADAATVHFDHRQPGRVLDFDGQFLPPVCFRPLTLPVDQTSAVLPGKTPDVATADVNFADGFENHFGPGEGSGLDRGQHHSADHARAEGLTLDAENFTLREKKFCGTAGSGTSVRKTPPRHRAW